MRSQICLCSKSRFNHCSLAETSVINIFDTNDGNVLAHLSGHRGNAPPHIVFINGMQTLVTGGGGQGDANLRVWPLADFLTRLRVFVLDASSANKKVILCWKNCIRKFSLRPHPKTAKG